MAPFFAVAMRQRVVCGDEVTHVVLDRSFRVVEPVERLLEYLRQYRYSPHMVRSRADVVTWRLGVTCG